MDAGYYHVLLPVREPGTGLPGMAADLRLPYRVVASPGVPAGRIIVAFVSDSARLSGMVAANWAAAGTVSCHAVRAGPAGLRGDDIVFVHGCALSLGARPDRRAW
jgi:hypothetical protein